MGPPKGAMSTVSPGRMCCWGLLLASIHISLTMAGARCNIPQLSEQKDMKKFIKSRSNIVVVFVSSEAELDSLAGRLLCETMERMRGQFDLAAVNCEGAGRKLCKQQKVNPAPSLIYHYSNGQFNKQYDRPAVPKSLVAFLKNPAGEAPWSDEPSAASVTHVEETPEFIRLITKERKPVLVMFYAPWCGHCKRLKPQYSAAAAQAKDKAVLAAMDVSTEEFAPIRYQYNVTGFPTLVYFKNGQPLYTYAGEQTASAIVDWLADPKPFEKKEKAAPADEEPAWEQSEAKDVIKFLDDETFQPFIDSNPSVYVMVYAPWCGHCKRMKPDYEEAARELSQAGVSGVLAAVDATKSPGVAKQLGVSGYPTVKYFQNGQQPEWTVNFRTKDTIVSFMKDPKEPPPEPKEVSWSEETTDVAFLDAESFSKTLKKKKAALVMFYAPWCGHCKRAKPEFNMAAAQLKPQTKALLGAVDCTKETSLCSKYGVSGYPTIKLFSYGKDPVDYNGDRTKGELVAFLNAAVATGKDEL